MNTLVLSGINLHEGGPLSIYKDCLDSIINESYYKQYKIIAFVHKKELFTNYENYIEVIELPKSRRHYIYRLFYEYIYFYYFSTTRKIDYWISLHDITPHVRTSKLFTYCHNPTPFMENPQSIKKFSKNIYYMAKFYKYLYRINIKKNTGLIVQQEWLRKKFIEMYHINNVIVATPDFMQSVLYDNLQSDQPTEKHEKNMFVYAAYPRAFKNFEVLCEAAIILEIEKFNFNVVLTIDGTENEYSKFLYRKYNHIHSIKWIGLQSRDNIFKLYNESDCMIFPSNLETWGLPITEYKKLGKPILAARLPYAFETVGNYDKVCFFDCNNASELALLMKKFINGTLELGKSELLKVNPPYAKDWKDLFHIIGL